jgi:integral membrane protein
MSTVKSIDHLPRSFKQLAFFDDREAWLIYRLAAFGEAIGWTLLIGGIIYQHYKLPNNHDVLKILGQTHGTLFFAYFAGLLAVARSLGLSKLQFLWALAVSIPPYGTLIFEKYLAHIRRQKAAKSHREIVVRALIKKGDSLLAVQPRRGTFWCLPGGRVAANETATEALSRLLHSQFGNKPSVGTLQFCQEYNHHGQLRLELFYSVTIHQPVALTEIGKQEYDELAYIIARDTHDLRPQALQNFRLIG